MLPRDRRRPSNRQQAPVDSPSNNNEEEDKAALAVLDGLKQLRENGIFCDVTLRVGEKTINAHKNVICACSPYLANVLGPFRESHVREIVINDIDPHYFELLVDYMYTGTLNFDYSNVTDVLLAASFLKMSSAEALCCTFLDNNLVFETCVQYILFAGKNSIGSLLSSSIEMAAINFHNIFFENEYLAIGLEEFKHLVNEVKNNGYPEDLIFAFVMRWINNATDERMQHLETLLNPREFTFISPEALDAFKVENESNPVFAAWAAQTNAAQSTAADQILVSRRLSTNGALKIKLFSLGDHQQIAFLPETIIDGSYVCHGYYIYHQGGWKSEKQLLTDSYAYHPGIRMWVPFVPLQQARAYHRSCVLDGRIYSVGGSDGIKAFSSVEYTDLCTGQRGFTAPLPLAKERAGLGVHENSIYVVGGSDRGRNYKCVHRFDAREGIWQELAPSPYRAGASSCAVVGEYIYTTHPDALQRYDIRANDWWLIYGQYQRYPQEVFAFENGLFGVFSSHIAKFLPERGKWQNLRALKFHLPHLQVSTNLRSVRTPMPWLIF